MSHFETEFIRRATDAGGLIKLDGNGHVQELRFAYRESPVDEHLEGIEKLPALEVSRQANTLIYLVVR